ncbi:polysaccharide biosynthesis tyrosine autokinase [Flavobacteriaceae bacterium F08102]|nr:polysaccharide biosynthesis tyrosine autokinase [Flavobacteriaceae bacterium F08102]
MEFSKKLSQQEEHNDGSNLDLRSIVDKYLGYWKWFLLAITLSLLNTFWNLNFSRDIYEAEASIKIKDEGGADKSTLSVFQDLGMMGNSHDNIEDEIEILTSKSLVSKAIEALKFNVQFFTNKNSISKFVDDHLGFSTEFYENERYTNPPLKINFFIPDSVLYTYGSTFYIHVDSESKFTYSNADHTINKQYAFGEKLKTSFSDIIITPSVDLKSAGLIGESILVKITSIQGMTNVYVNNLTVEPISKYSNVLSLKATDTDKRKAEDFLNELVRQYNKRAVALKEELSSNTAKFVNDRLIAISEELTEIDLSAESLKKKYQLSDQASETGINMQASQELDRQKAIADAQLQKIRYMKEYVKSADNTTSIPGNILTQDNSLNEAISKYTEIQQERTRLLNLKAKEKNPAIVRLDEALKDIKDNIQLGLENLEESQQITLNSLNRQAGKINYKLNSTPTQEREYRDISRQQKIKEDLFLYLLQKREETGITLGVVDPNAIIIDPAMSGSSPTGPNRFMSYISAIILGLVVPFAILYVRDLLDTKIHTRQEVEKILNIPIIGDIPKLETKGRYLITESDNSGIAESFRILRTNLNFVLDSKIQGKTIFITSTIAHEGKSMVASNLATSLAHAGKKTLLLGMDIRAPKIEAYLDVRGEKGVTNFIINPSITVESITNPVPSNKNLFVISSGDLAPNPSELLMHPRVKELFQKVKEEYDYIIVDTAAFSMVTDTLLLSSYANSFIYIVRTNFLDKRMLQYVKSIYDDRRIPNMSILINGIDSKQGYGYGYGYGTAFEKSKRKAWWKFKKA